MKFAFFGTPDLAVNALSRMEAVGLVPSLIVTTPDAPVGRKHIITPPPTKVWGAKRDIPVFQPETLKHEAALTPLTATSWDFFVVFAYGKIMPEWLLSLPTYGTINAHPSLLPKLRGASPIRSTILTDLSAAGVTIIQMDKEMDHGPILSQQPITLESPLPGQRLDHTLSLLCGDLLAEVMQGLVDGSVTPKDQDHTAATFCTKITKDMAEVAIDPYQLPIGTEAYTIFRKIMAFDGWPETFFMHEGARFKIKSAHLTNDGILEIDRIVPEGKKEMNFKDYFAI
jgi:methionyl-tRNA formyltransferase